MKVVFVCNELGYFRHHREHLVEAILPYANKVIVYATPVGATATDAKFDFRPIQIERFRFHPRLDFNLFRTVFRTLLRDRPDILHLFSLKPYLFGGIGALVARLFGWKGRLIITVPGLGRLYDPDLKRPRRAAIRRAIVQAFLRGVVRRATVTFETTHDRDVWLRAKLISPQQATVVMGAGLDFERFFPRPERRTAEKLKVLFASRLLFGKGLDVYLKTASLVHANGGSGIDMFVAGFVENDPDAMPIEKLKSCKDITFLGPVADMAELLRDVDIVALPSRYSEGIPRILIEAAGCGCVPIATRFPGSEQVIVHNETGLLLEATDPDSQANELAVLLTSLRQDANLRHELGTKAAAFVRANGFGAEDVAATFVSLYAAAS
jgi:glycosyltransferase involved in cell wall biosynthesis